MRWVECGAGWVGVDADDVESGGSSHIGFKMLLVMKFVAIKRRWLKCRTFRELAPGDDRFFISGSRNSCIFYILTESLNSSSCLYIIIF